jgi:hypothetical protein
VSEVWLTHHFVRSGAEAAAVALNLGHTDIDCGAQYAGGKQWNDGARPPRAAACCERVWAVETSASTSRPPATCALCRVRSVSCWALQSLRRCMLARSCRRQHPGGAGPQPDHHGQRGGIASPTLRRAPQAGAAGSSLRSAVSVHPRHRSRLARNPTERARAHGCCTEPGVRQAERGDAQARSAAF